MNLDTMKRNYKRWCKEFGIPPQRVTPKFWLTGQYGKTGRIVEGLKKAENLPILPAPKLS